MIKKDKGSGRKAARNMSRDQEHPHSLIIFSDIRAKLSVLRSLFRRQKTFEVHGSEAHKFRLHKRLQVSTIAALERKYAINLPDDYRFFLSHVGNGGAGPGYGLLSLVESLTVSPNVAKPFYPRKKQLSSLMSISKRVPPGLLILSDQGCGERIALAITGPERGSLWWNMLELPWIPVTSRWPEILAAQKNNWLAAHKYIREHLSDIHALSFSEWYMSWLNEVYAEVASD